MRASSFAAGQSPVRIEMGRIHDAAKKGDAKAVDEEIQRGMINETDTVRSFPLVPIPALDTVNGPCPSLAA